MHNDFREKMKFVLNRNVFNVPRCDNWLMGNCFIRYDRNSFDFKVYIGDKSEAEVVDRMLALFIGGKTDSFEFLIDIEDSVLKLVDNNNLYNVAYIDYVFYFDMYNSLLPYLHYFNLTNFEIEIDCDNVFEEEDVYTEYVLKFGFSAKEGIEMSDVRDEAVCINCGRVDYYPRGYLTEKAMKQYRCKVCRQDIFELAVDERENEDLELLID